MEREADEDLRRGYPHDAWTEAWVWRVCTWKISISKIRLSWVEGNILGECTGERFFAADLLAADEGVYGHSDGTVDILCGTVL